MCKISKNGYEFKSTGRTLTNPKLDDLKQEEINELYGDDVNAMEVFKIKNNIQQLSDNVLLIVAKLDVVMGELKKHSRDCPIAKTTINNMIDSRIKTTIDDAKNIKGSPFEEARIETIKRYNKATFFNFVSIIKGFSILFTFILLIFGILKTIF